MLSYPFFAFSVSDVCLCFLNKMFIDIDTDKKNGEMFVAIYNLLMNFSSIMDRLDAVIN